MKKPGRPKRPLSSRMWRRTKKRKQAKLESRGGDCRPVRPKPSLEERQAVSQKKAEEAELRGKKRVADRRAEEDKQRGLMEDLRGWFARITGSDDRLRRAEGRRKHRAERPKKAEERRKHKAVLRLAAQRKAEEELRQRGD